MISVTNSNGARVSLLVTTEKNLVAEISNGESTTKITSKDVDITLPSTAVITWTAASGKIELRIRDAPGKSFTGSSNLAAPSSPLIWMELGKALDKNHVFASESERFNGRIAEIILYASVPSNDQLQMLEGRVLREPYIQGNALPKK